MIGSHISILTRLHGISENIELRDLEVESCGAAGGIRALDFEIKSLHLKENRYLISGKVRDNDPIVLAERCQPDYESRALTRLGHCGTDSDDRNMI